MVEGGSPRLTPERWLQHLAGFLDENHTTLLRWWTLAGQEGHVPEAHVAVELACVALASIAGKRGRQAVAVMG
jgi:hypothetical protein